MEPARREFDDLFIVSADSHVTEPADLWRRRLDRGLRDRAPRVVRDYGTDRYLFVAPGISPFPIATGFGAGKQGRDLKQHLRRGYEAARPGGWDPVERIKDQDVDGVACEVPYPTPGMKLFALPHDEAKTPILLLTANHTLLFSVLRLLASLYQIGPPGHG